MGKEIWGGGGEGEEEEGGGDRRQEEEVKKLCHRVFALDDLTYHFHSDADLGQI